MALALYRKYRPRTFAEVIGQEHVTEPLSQALRSGRLHHAYLFSGPRGCGKTSSARILARSLNCEQGPTPEPCGVCASCRSLANDGTGSIDVIEIDAASHGGVDDARDLREKAFFAPAGSRYKVYVIDEAHMVSSAGFNALLKLVEEPPDYVKFIFATTEPEKVLGTIKSRTHHYPFRLIPPAVLRPYLQQLAEAEGISVEPAVFPLVVRAGGGSVRDTLSMLDQLIAGAGPEGVTYARAVALLGVTDVTLIDDMCDALAAEDGAAAFATIDRVAEAGHDPRRFASDLLERFRDLIVLQQVPDAVAKGLIDGPTDQLDAMTAQATRLGPATLSRCADIVHNGLVEMRGTTAPRLLLELITARMLLPGADDSASALLQRLERMERRLTLTGDTTDAVRLDPSPAAAADSGDGGAWAARAADRRRSAADEKPSGRTPTRTASVSSPPQPATASGGDEPPAAPEAVDSGAAAPSTASGVSTPSAAPAGAVAGRARSAPPARRPEPAGVLPDAPDETGSTPDGVGHLTAASIREVWPEIITTVGRQSKKMAALASGATVRDLDGQTLVLTFRFPAHAKMVATDPDLITNALYEALGGRWEIRCEVAGEAGAVPVASSGPVSRRAPAQKKAPTAVAAPPAAGPTVAATPTAATPAPTAAPAMAAPATAPVAPAHPRDAARHPDADASSARGSSDDDWPEPARPGGLGAAPAAGAPDGAAPAAGARNGAAPAAGALDGAAARPATGRPVAAPAGSGADDWPDGVGTEEPPYDPDYDGPTGAETVAYEGFDPGDEPLDDVPDENTARQSSEQQAMQLLQDAFGAERIGEA